MPKHVNAATALFALAAVLLALALSLAGRELYGSGPNASYDRKLAESLLQLGVIVIGGALLKALIDWGTAQRTRYRERHDRQAEFLRRVRALHVAVENARSLLRAHNSAKTYVEQSRRLMDLRPEVEEVSEDLAACPGLFPEQGTIVDALDGIAGYLIEGEREYMRCHEHIDQGHKTGETVTATIEAHDMGWIKDLMEGGDDYAKAYAENLRCSKGAMRRQVYGE